MPLSRLRLVSVIAAATPGLLLPGRNAAAADPTKQECVVANENAQDLQRAGKLVQARLQLLTCSSSACPAAVRQDCADQLEAVGQALPLIVLTPKDAGGGDASRAGLAIDGVAQNVVLDGTPVPVDPGQHTFTVTLAGRSPVSLRLSFTEGDRVRRDVVFEAAAPAAREGPSRSGGGAEADVATVSSRATAEGTVRSMHRVAWSAIGVGAAGVTLGTLFGLLALDKKASLDRACRDTSCPTGSLGDIEGMHVNAVASNVSFAAGLLGLGAGIALLFLYPESPSPDALPEAAGALRVRAWAGPGDVGVQGSFR